MIRDDTPYGELRRSSTPIFAKLRGGVALNRSLAAGFYHYSVATKINKIQRNVVVIKWLMKKPGVKWAVTVI